MSGLDDLAARREQREWDDTRVALQRVVRGVRPLYVVAGNLREAERWAERCHLVPGDWRYVGSVERLAGSRRITYTLVGTYWRRPDWPEIRDQLHELEAQRLR